MNEILSGSSISLGFRFGKKIEASLLGGGLSQGFWDGVTLAAGVMQCLMW